MSNWKKIDKDTPRDQDILLYKKARDGRKLIVIGELCDYDGRTHHLWSGMYSSVITSCIWSLELPFRRNMGGVGISSLEPEVYPLATTGGLT